MVLVGTFLTTGVIAYFNHKESKKRVIRARQRIGKSSYYVYINNYDDQELNEKVRKVMDADKHQININDESDLEQLNLRRRQNPGFLPATRMSLSDLSQVQQFNFSQHGEGSDESLTDES